MRNNVKYNDMIKDVYKDLNYCYQLLGRLEQDCNYYLGYGNRNKNKLWALDEVEQIKEMKKIYNSFSEDEKPIWITMEKIEKYEKEMLKGV